MNFGEIASPAHRFSAPPTRSALIFWALYGVPVVYRSTTSYQANRAVWRRCSHLELGPQTKREQTPSRSKEYSVRPWGCVPEVLYGGLYFVPVGLFGERQPHDIAA